MLNTLISNNTRRFQLIAHLRTKDSDVFEVVSVLNDTVVFRNVKTKQKHKQSYSAFEKSKFIDMLLQEVLSRNVLSETQLQKQCVQYYNIAFPNRIIVNINNNDLRANVSGMGIHKGASDLMLVGVYGVLYVELKFGKGSQEDEQIEFQRHVQSSGHGYVICYDINEFTRIANDFNNNKKNGVLGFADISKLKKEIEKENNFISFFYRESALQKRDLIDCKETFNKAISEKLGTEKEIKSYIDKLRRKRDRKTKTR